MQSWARNFVGSPEIFSRTMKSPRSHPWSFPKSYRSCLSRKIGDTSIQDETCSIARGIGFSQPSQGRGGTGDVYEFARIAEIREKSRVIVRQTKFHIYELSRGLKNIIPDRTALRFVGLVAATDRRSSQCVCQPTAVPTLFTIAARLHVSFPMHRVETKTYIFSQQIYTDIYIFIINI